MKKLLLLTLIGTTMLSCQSETEQVKVAKQQLKKIGYSDTEIAQYTFTQGEFLGNDIYKMINKKYEQKVSSGKKLGDYKMMEDNLKIQSINLVKSANAKSVMFWKVEAVQMDGADTLHHKIVYLDEKNKVLDDYNRK